MARGGIRFDLSFRNLSGTIARIHTADRDCQAAVREAVRDAGEFCKELTQEYCPKDTGFMAKHVKTRYNDEGLAFETGWLEDDFKGAGLAFYPPYVEFGTMKMRAQPSLYPAYKETQKYLLETLRATLRDAIERGGGRTRGTTR